MFIFQPVPQTWWGGPGFNYSVQWRRKTYDALGRSENRWLNLPREQDIRILDGNNNSVPVKNPGYYVEWEFRIRSNNAKGSAPTWRYGSSFSGQDRKLFCLVLTSIHKQQLLLFSVVKHKNDHIYF